MSKANPISVRIRSSIFAFRYLKTQFGLKTTMTILADLSKRSKKGEPWDQLPPPEDKKEKISREQAKDAVLLYRALLAFSDPKTALEATAKIVLEGSIHFLRSQIPIIHPEEMIAMPKKKQHDFVMGIADRFFNADMGEVELTDHSFRYLITRCRFPELMKAVGHPELAPLFCSGDKVFFDTYQPHIRFKRPVTLSVEGEPCDFQFELILKD